MSAESALFDGKTMSAAVCFVIPKISLTLVSLLMHRRLFAWEVHDTYQQRQYQNESRPVLLDFQPRKYIVQHCSTSDDQFPCTNPRGSIFSKNVTSALLNNEVLPKTAGVNDALSVEEPSPRGHRFALH